MLYSDTVELKMNIEEDNVTTDIITEEKTVGDAFDPVEEEKQTVKETHGEDHIQLTIEVNPKMMNNNSGPNVLSD